MLYQRTVKIFSLGLVCSMAFRAALKILVVDTGTGFYNGAGLLVLLSRVVLIGSLAAGIFFIFREKDRGMAPVKGNLWLEASAAAVGVALALEGAFNFLDALGLPWETVPNAMPKWFCLADGLLEVLSGLIFLYLAFAFFSGAARGGFGGTLALVAAVWQAVSMVRRFNSFRQVTTASDQLLETLFMACATYFLLTHARVVADIGAKRKLSLAFSFSTALFGLTLAFGQFAGMLVLGTGISGPSPARTVLVAVMGVYALIYGITLCRTPELE